MGIGDHFTCLMGRGYGFPFMLGVIVVIHILPVMNDRVTDICRDIDHLDDSILLRQLSRGIINGQLAVSQRHTAAEAALILQHRRIAGDRIQVKGILIFGARGQLCNMRRGSGSAVAVLILHDHIDLLQVLSSRAGRTGRRFSLHPHRDGRAGLGLLPRSHHAADSRRALQVQNTFNNGLGNQNTLAGLALDIHPQIIGHVIADLPPVRNTVSIVQIAPRTEAALLAPGQANTAGHIRAAAVHHSHFRALGQSGSFGNHRFGHQRIQRLMSLAADIAGIPHRRFNRDKFQYGRPVIGLIRIVLHDPRGLRPGVILCAFRECTAVQLHPVPQGGGAGIPVPVGDLHNGILTEFVVIERNSFPVFCGIGRNICTQFICRFEDQPDILTHIAGAVIGVFGIAVVRMDHSTVLCQGIIAVGAGFRLFRQGLEGQQADHSQERQHQRQNSLFHTPTPFPARDSQAWAGVSKPLLCTAKARNTMEMGFSSSPTFSSVSIASLVIV